MMWAYTALSPKEEITEQITRLFFSLHIPLLDSDEIINVMYSKREKCDILSDKMIEFFSLRL